MASRFSRSTCRSTASTGNSPSLIAEIEDRFHRRHEELYTYASRDQEVVFVNARVAAVGAVARAAEGAKAARRRRACKPVGTRKAYFGGWREVAVYALDDLKPGHGSKGPRSSRPRRRRS